MIMRLKRVITQARAGINLPSGCWLMQKRFQLLAAEQNAAALPKQLAACILECLIRTARHAYLVQSIPAGLRLVRANQAPRKRAAHRRS